MAKEKKKQTPQANPLGELTWILAWLTDAVNKINSRLDKLESSNGKTEESKDKYKELQEQAVRNANNYSTQAYKVLEYRWPFLDQMTNTMKKSYVVPGRTFKTKQAAQDYINKNPGRQFELFPI